MKDEPKEFEDWKEEQRARLSRRISDLRKDIERRDYQHDVWKANLIGLIEEYDAELRRLEN